MPSIKTIKRRISSATTTRQIMKAMDMVAAAKLKKTRERLDVTRLLVDESKRIIGSIGEGGATDSVFFRPSGKAERSAAYLVVTGDRGLCGSYNTTVSEKALEHMQKGRSEKIIAVGLRGWEYFRRRKKNLVKRYVGVMETLNFKEAARIGDQLLSMYMSGEVDEVYIAYTYFESSLVHVPQIVKVLPIAGGTGNTFSPMRYEPDIHTFLSYVVPAYVHNLIYGALVESSTCEQAARMVSMSAASNNAQEIIDDLTHMHNRIRQASITQEINEIISGTNILR